MKALGLTRPTSGADYLSSAEVSTSPLEWIAHCGTIFLIGCSKLDHRNLSRYIQQGQQYVCLAPHSGSLILFNVLLIGDLVSGVCCIISAGIIILSPPSDPRSQATSSNCYQVVHVAVESIRFRPLCCLSLKLDSLLSYFTPAFFPCRHLLRWSNGTIALRMGTSILDAIRVNSWRSAVHKLTLGSSLLARVVDVFEIESVNVAGNVAQEGQADIDEEISATARNEEDSNGWNYMIC